MIDDSISYTIYGYVITRDELQAGLYEFTLWLCVLAILTILSARYEGRRGAIRTAITVGLGLLIGRFVIWRFVI